MAARGAILRSKIPDGTTTEQPSDDSSWMLWLLATGAPWRDLPARFGPWQTVYGRFRAWSASGVLDRVFARLRRDLIASSQLDLEVWCVDTTVVRASRAAAGARKRPAPSREPRDHALGRSRGGFGTKVSVVCDARGLPLAAEVRPGQQHDSKAVQAVVRAATVSATPRCLTADKAYSMAWIREWLHGRGIVPVIPTRSDQEADRRFDRGRYRRRNVVERLVGWLKESRRIATRYEKLATTYLAFVTLAMTRRLLRALVGFPDRP